MKSAYIFLTLLIFCSSANAQDSCSHSKYALSFGIGPNFTLNRFDMDIAVKKVIDENHQLRLFLSPDIITRNDKIEYGSGAETENEAFNYSLGIGADYLWTLMRNEDISMFGGTGLLFRYGNTHEKQTNKNQPGETINERNGPYGGAELRGTIGVEWMVSSKIGIHSEYILSGAYRWEKNEVESTVDGVKNPANIRKYSSINLNTSVLFGISIYL